MAPKTASMVRRRTGLCGLQYPQRSRMTGRSPSLPGIQLDMDEIDIELSSQQATKEGGCRQWRQLEHNPYSSNLWVWMVNPFLRATSSWRRSMSQFSNSTIFPQAVQIRWSWCPL